MKKNIALTTVILALTTAPLLFTGCNKPAERPSAVNTGVAPNLYAVTDFSEITTADVKSPKTVYYSGEKKTEMLAQNGDKKPMDASLKQVKIEGKVQDLLKLVSKEDTKKMLEDHLKTGVIAVVILNDEIKVLKVVPETISTFDLTLLSLTYLSTFKAYVKTSDKVNQSSLVSQLNTLRYKSPADLGEKFGLAEISSIIVKKHGNLDNERNDYNEKKSILNVIDSPFEVSTHLVLGTEVGNEAAAKEAAEQEAAAKKASE